MSQYVVAKRYAKAAYELLRDAGNTELFFDQVVPFADEILNDKSLAGFFLNPTVQRELKVEVMQKATAAIDATCGRFLVLLANKGRLEIMREIIRAYEELYNAEKNIVQADVRSAFALSDTTKEEIRTCLEALTNKKITMEVSVDDSLIGGMTAQIGSTLYDGSVRGQLDKLKESLVKA
ncbi:F0F1 ATP synthase subunit delta [Chrysiogenes arsenatis]|uniref:F0F1 ATP synthase subunit delta n=1 Tax=Chrysiogenes arsenatis TaxID=309797 RepID=UPI0004173232|nr:F0F1 ATP synthase subunit delta [Chrysiogenes arsenatis]